MSDHLKKSYVMPPRGAYPELDAALDRLEKNESNLRQIHFAAIGLVACQWAVFEASIDRWLLDFSGLPPEIGICFTGQMLGYRPRLDALIALVKHLGAPPKLLKGLVKLADDKARSLAERRNRVVHDVWDLTAPTEASRLEMSARRSVRLEEVTHTGDRVAELSVEISELESALSMLCGEIQAALLASPQIPKPERPS